jgi:hypothetical protein
MAFWICAIGLPLVAGLHRYAASYGYRGVSRRQAWGEAWRTAAMLAIFTGLFAIAKLTEID